MGTFLVIGGTGLVGRAALPLLLQRHPSAHVLAVQRKPLAEQPRLHVLQRDLSDPAIEQAIADRLAGLPPLAAFVCCLGTTRRRAGSAAAFIAIDRDLVVRIARIAATLGARQAVMVSSVGADPHASGLYLRTKGEAERDIAALGYARCDFLRPGLLIGDRDERRPAEHLAQRASPLLDRLLVGGLRRYRSLPGDAVASAIANLVGRETPGRYVHEHDAIRSAALRLPDQNDGSSEIPTPR